ncbi:MAG: oligoribonuclease [Bdellovibrio sp.]
MTQKKSEARLEKLFWIDMEMTGLDVQKEGIIECAVLITNLQFDVLEQFESVVFQPPLLLEAMDEWNKQHHRDSGLTEKVPKGKPLDEVENQLIRMAQKHFPDPRNRPVLAGNSIAQDRLFIEKYMPRFAQLLHYRTLDVSSWKLIFQNRFYQKYEKKNAHRALEDILESVAELKFYLSFIQA